MCCGDKRGNHGRPITGPMHHGAHHSGGQGMHEICGCEEKQGHHSAAHGTCGCAGRRFLSRKERIEMLEEYRESLKCELEGVEEELKRLQVE